MQVAARQHAERGLRVWAAAYHGAQVLVAHVAVVERQLPDMHHPVALRGVRNVGAAVIVLHKGRGFMRQGCSTGGAA